MAWYRGALGILLALTLATPLAAQRSCRSVLPSDFRRLVNARGEELAYFYDPVRLLCEGNVRLEADSAVWNRSAGRLELVGNVVYQDSVRRLTAEWANYLGRNEQLLARDSAVIEDLVEGAIISGEQLNYLRETETRPVARLIVTGGRPHAILPARDSTRTSSGPAPDRGGREPPSKAPPDPSRSDAMAGEPAGGTSTHVWADRLEVEGSIFRANGDVELERADLTGSGRSAVYEQDLDRLSLTGEARLVNEAYRLSGDEVEAELEGDELRELRSRGNARARSEELEIRSERIRIRFAGGALQGLEAWNVEPEARRVWAAAEDFQMRADSLEALADSAGLQELRAIGRAYGERIVPDEAPADTSLAALPVDVARDWVQGDTILGYFRQVRERLEDAGASDRPAGPQDSVVVLDPERTAGDRTVLERIEVAGGDAAALSLYRMADTEGGRPAINFMKARRIVLFMEQGEVARLEAEGPIEGMYLEPRGAVEDGEEATREGGAG